MIHILTFTPSRYNKPGTDEWHDDDLGYEGHRFAFEDDVRQHTTYSFAAVGPNSISNQPKPGRTWQNVATQKATAFMFANAVVISAHPIEEDPVTVLNDGDYIVDAENGWIVRVFAPLTRNAEPVVLIVACPPQYRDRSAQCAEIEATRAARR